MRLELRGVRFVHYLIAHLVVGFQPRVNLAPTLVEATDVKAKADTQTFVHNDVEEEGPHIFVLLLAKNEDEGEAAEDKEYCDTDN